MSVLCECVCVCEGHLYQVDHNTLVYLLGMEWASSTGVVAGE